jgi:beta-lactam-binding protein with PASTA domain
MDFSNLKQFIKSSAFKKNLKWFAIGLLIFFLLITFILRIYTHHGSSRAVPDVKGMTLSEATNLIEDKGLNVQISDSVFDKTLPPGAVVDQDPKAGAKVKKNRTIFLVMNATNPEMIKVPNIVGISIRQASAMLESAGLEVGNISYIPDIATNNVLAQKYRGVEIGENKLVPKGSRIDLVLGKGVGLESVKVPSIIGMNLAKARQLLTGSFLNIGAVVTDNTITVASDSLSAVIFKQKPASGYVNPGSYIDVWITKDLDKAAKAEEDVETVDESENQYE